MDYRQVNECTKVDAWPLPRLDETLDLLLGIRWFSKIDLVCGYWNVAIDSKDKEKTVFTMGTGLFEFNVLPFRLCNALSCFSRLMEYILAGLHWPHCLIYLNNVFIPFVSVSQGLD